MQRASSLFFVSLILFALGCGADRTITLKMDSATGPYTVEISALKAAGSCAFTSFVIAQNLNEGAVLEQTSDGNVKIELPGYNITLEGTVAGNTITARGAFALGGDGAAALDTTWVYTTNGFNVNYVYTEAFVGRESDCEKEFGGSAVQQ